MSTTYVTIVSPHEFAATVTDMGWFPLPSTEGNPYTDGTNYVWATYDGDTLFLDRYGRNSAYDLVDALGMVSEHDEEFEEIAGYGDYMNGD